MEQSYEHIRCHYGEENCQIFKSYSKNLQKLAKLQESRKFLLKCRTYGLLPKFITDSTSNICELFGACPAVSSSLHNYIINFGYKILNLKIKEKCWVLKKQEKITNELRSHILENFPNSLVLQFFDSQNLAYNRFKNKVSMTHEKKFNNLKTKAINDLGLTVNGAWFNNRTALEFPAESQLLLSLGKKFSLPYDNKDLPILQMIADSEVCLQTITEDRQREITRAKLCNLIHEYSKNVKFARYNKLILKMYDDTIKFLAQHKNEIIITTADKGGVTVAMWRKEYMDKINSLLSDRNTYRTLRIDPTNKLQTKNNEYIKFLKETNLISDREKYFLTTYKGLPPRLYGLPKIHKDNCPIRPIVSSIQSPVYNLSKYLASVLNNLTKDSVFNVENAISFKRKIDKLKIDENETMVSFDVISLFTNVPINLCLKIIDNKWDQLSQFTDIPKRKFLDMLQLCIVDANYFVFNNTTYKQVFGVPMGSPLSPILADIFMEELLTKSIEKMQNQPKVLFKYVDDLFSVVPQEYLPAILNTLNSFHPKVQFTAEHEKDKVLPYLDAKVIRDGCNLITDWYRKPTSSGRLLHFKSYHPRHQKINTAKNFISRVLDLSDRRFHSTNTVKIRKILEENGFPKPIINGLLNQYKPVMTDKAPEINNSCTFRGATYIPGFSERLRSLINTQHKQLKIAFKPQKTTQQFFSRLKDSRPKEFSSNVIYKIPCKGNAENNCRLSYVGTTGQFLKNRISNHKSDLKNKNANKTALSAHCSLLNHVPNFDDVRILHQENNYTKRMILESLYIQKTPFTMNKKTDCDNISSTYCALLGNFHECPLNNF